MLAVIKKFGQSPSATGILLIAAAVIALIIANSPLSWLYDDFLNIPVQVRAGQLNIEKPLLLWVNDGLMAVFFFLVGLELKREMIAGELSSPSKLVLPALAAIGGIVVPSGVYAWINWGDALAIQGWAIPAATDIAFAFGILMLLGSRVPTSMKVFLVSLAIIDDIGAILIIAFFYTAELSQLSLLIAASCLVVLFIMNKRGVSHAFPYLLVGLILWISVLKSGVHATLAGVALALFIPYSCKDDPDHSLVKTLEHELHTTVAFFILPLFAFVNAGVSLEGMTLSSLTTSIPLGIIAGLVLGKTFGVYLVTWLAVQMKFAPLPTGMNWGSLLGLSFLTGVGFTMSLFVASLAFEGVGLPYSGSERLAIMLGSAIAAIAGFVILHLTLPKQP